jgi:hypothetical protein
MAKKHFCQKLKNEAFFQKLFSDLKALFLKLNPKHALNQAQNGFRSLN